MAAVCADEGRLPGMIGVFAAFDPDDVGAEIGEQAGAKRAGEHVSEIQHPDARERRRNGWLRVGGHRLSEY